jgi:hypothetical protein
MGRYSDAVTGGRRRRQIGIGLAETGAGQQQKHEKTNRNTGGKRRGKMKNREERKGSNLEVLVDCDSLYGAIMHLFSLSWFLKIGK